MNLVYGVKDRPKFGQTIVFALQQLLAILAATIAVPSIVGNGMSQSAALFGAGVGTLVYLCFTKFKSPVFLGSSFAFLGSMFAAFAGAVSVNAGYMGLVLGAVFGERMILVQGQIPGCAPHPSILYVNGSVHSVHLREDVTFSLCQSFNDIGVDVFHVLILNKCHISPQSPEIIVIFQY